MQCQRVNIIKQRENRKNLNFWIRNLCFRVK